MGCSASKTQSVLLSHVGEKKGVASWREKRAQKAKSRTCFLLCSQKDMPGAVKMGDLLTSGSHAGIVGATAHDVSDRL